MVKIRVDYNKLYMVRGKNRIQLESATIYERKNGFEITVFIFDTGKRHTVKQKQFDGIPNATFIEAKHIDKNTILSFASGSLESPNSKNWYINYYKIKNEETT